MIYIYTLPPQASQLQDVPLVGEQAGSGEDSEVALSEDDMDFVEQYGSHLGFLSALDKKQLDKWVVPWHGGPVHKAGGAGGVRHLYAHAWVCGAVPNDAACMHSPV